MFSRLMEKIMRCSTKSVSDDGYLSHHLKTVTSRYAGRYEETMKELPERERESLDALDVLARLVMEELGIKEADYSAARAYLSILIENEHLATQCQLVESELLHLKELLFSYFQGAEDTNAKGAQVLSLIEKKFANGEFSQARILLQIFETNEETRQNNERNLFYEEMILRLDGSVSRVHALPESVIKAAVSEKASDDDVLKAFSTLEQNADAKFCLYLRDPVELREWKKAISTLPEDVQSFLLDYIPIVRWRKMGMTEGSLMTQFGQHMTFEMLRRHILQKLKMCYFILLASGNTGFEWFVFSFSKWSREHFDVDMLEVLPMVHRSGIVDNMCLQEILDVVIDRYYGRKMNELAISAETLELAYRASLKFIFESDVNRIPPGYYNFGDFLLDQILPFEYEDPMFAYRLHSMM